MAAESERIKLEEFTVQIQAWEDKEKAIIENKAERRLSQADSMMKKKQADREAKLKHIETKAERFKQLELEKLKNEEALTKKAVGQKKAAIQAQRETEKLKLGEKASKYRSTKTLPKKCFGLCEE